MEAVQQYDELDISLESSISMESVLYDLFYRQHGIRRTQQLDTPTISDLSTVVLPKFSIYHYNPESTLLFGPTENNPFFKNDRHIRFINHVEDYLVPPQGMVIRKPGSPKLYIGAYRRKHRTLKLLRDFFGVNRQGNMLIIYNYCLINQLYKYRPHRLTNYYRFMNMYQTILKQIDIVAAQSERQQFLEVRLPTKFLPRGLYRSLTKEYANGINNRLLKTFQDDDAWLLFHLWLWVGDEAKYSIFNNINPHHYSKINLIFTDSGKYTVVNLGYLAKWKGERVDETYDEDGNLLEGAEENSGSRLEIRFYKFLSALFANRVGDGFVKVEVPTYTEAELNDETELDDDNNDVVPVEEVKPETTSTTSEPEPEEPPPTINPIKVKEKLNEYVTGKKPEPVKPKKGKDLTVYQEQPEPIPTILPEEETEDTVIEVAETPEQSLIEEPDDFPTFTLEEQHEPMLAGVLEDAMQLLDAGLMSAKQYGRVKQQAELYKTVPSPYYENETLADTATVSQELITNIEPKKVPDTPWILDKSMLNVSNEHVDQEYLKKVYPRNVIQSILGIQKAGVLVTDIKREVITDVAGGTEEFKIKVQPIGGVESTLTIRLPVIDPESGTFRVGSTLYSKRKLRYDIPLRKVGPTKVALTSYYGKLNVTKSDRKVFNLENYITTQIQCNIMDGVYHDALYGAKFDKSLKQHTHYTTPAKRFPQFSLFDKATNTRWDMNFDYHQRNQLTKGNEVLLTQLEEQHQGTLIGVSAKQQYAFLDQTTGEVILSDNTRVPYITFMQFSGTPPVEIAEIKIFSKTIPVGILLGYYLGLTNLCRLLGVRPRKYFRGQRTQQTEHDYALKFGDETWVFDKRNYKASLILNGFNHYKRYIQDYSANQYDDKDVYLAILRDAGLPATIENEFKLMKRMFIDDITKSLLESMKEPTTFIPLLVRAVELLTISWSRDEINMDDMLISGHQRMAGMIYTELVKQYKLMNGKPSAHKPRFDLPPDYILQKIMKDPSVTLVDDINPIHNIKEHDNVTFNGTGGRTNRTMVARTRAYHESDLGTISEATVDNQSVGVNTFLTSSVPYSNLYGKTDRIDLNTNEVGSANILSVSATLAVGSDADDQQIYI